MTARNRREKVYDFLRQNKGAYLLSDLAEQLKEDEKVLEGDLILLRASHKNVIKEGKLYYVREQKLPFEGVLSCEHCDVRLAEEFKMIIEAGAHLLTEEVIHPQYGHLVAKLDLKALNEVEAFIEHLSGPSLGSLLGGHHYHRLACQSEEAFAAIIDQLEEANFKVRKEDLEKYGS